MNAILCPACGAETEPVVEDDGNLCLILCDSCAYVFNPVRLLYRFTREATHCKQTSLESISTGRGVRRGR